MAKIHTDHWRLTAAGWSYRNNERGWIIYRDPQTGRWYTAGEAIGIMEAQTNYPTAA